MFLLKPVSIVIKFGCAAHCVFEFLADFVVCSGVSMEPAINSGDVILTEHVSPALRDFKRGDVIVCRSPLNPRNCICKRIVGIPGDSVRNGTVVPIGHLWLGGDNEENSMDSSAYGPVPQGLAISRAVCKIWPLRSVRMLTGGREPD